MPGNAVLFQNEPRVTTFSMHCRQNIFSIKQSSDIDVELQEGTEDAEYLAKLQSWSVQYPSQYTSLHYTAVLYDAAHGAMSYLTISPLLIWFHLC
jgi:acetoin utilization deacetylase AcuC-like enzyme